MKLGMYNLILKKMLSYYVLAIYMYPKNIQAAIRKNFFFARHNYYSSYSKFEHRDNSDFISKK